MREALPYVSAQRTNTPLPPTLTLRMRTTTREALALLEVEGGLWIPHSSSSQMAALQAFRAHLQDRASFELEAHLPNGSLAQPPRYAHPPYESDQSWMWAHTSGNHRPQAAHDAFQLLQNESQRVRESIFYFDARRTDFARCVDSGAVDIGSNGSNLATALAQRQQNQPKYKAYLSLVQRVIPDLEWISAETSNNEARLLSWLEPPGERSGEQRMSISECGAGVGHVLAMIYVAFYERNRTLLIDEPQAYLHPKACRELIRVFQDLRQHGHQFVIATHSTAMLSEAMPANVIEVHRQKQCSVLRSTSAKTMRDACAVYRSWEHVGPMFSDQTDSCGSKVRPKPPATLCCSRAYVHNTQPRSFLFTLQLISLRARRATRPSLRSTSTPKSHHTCRSPRSGA